MTRIVTYGTGQKSHWVKRYLMQFSSDDVVWHNYTENGFVKVRKRQSFVFRRTPSPANQMYCQTRMKTILLSLVGICWKLRQVNPSLPSAYQ